MSIDGAKTGRSNANKEPMGPFDTKNQSKLMPKSNNEAIIEMNETEPTDDQQDIAGESTDEEDVQIKEGDHKAKIQKVFHDRMRKYRRESKR